jgi:hypothetical protein
MPTLPKFTGKSSPFGNRVGMRERDTESHGTVPLRKQFSEGNCVRQGFSVWCIHSKYMPSACSHAHPCALREGQTRREAGAQSLYGPPRGSSRRRPGCRTAAVESQSSATREGRGCESNLTLWAINRELLCGNHRKFIGACSPRAAESQETLHLRGELDRAFDSHAHLQHQQSYGVYRRLRRRV